MCSVERGESRRGTHESEHCKQTAVVISYQHQNKLVTNWVDWMLDAEEREKYFYLVGRQSQLAIHGTEHCKQTSPVISYQR